MCTAFLLTGIIFGIAPLKVILIREEQYHEDCPDDLICPAQIDHYNVMFTLAQFFLSFGSLFVGILMDHTNKSHLYMGIAVVQAVGLVLFAISDSKERDYFVVSYSLLAIGGSLTMLVSQFILSLFFNLKYIWYRLSIYLTNYYSQSSLLIHSRRDSQLPFCCPMFKQAFWLPFLVSLTHPPLFLPSLRSSM